VNGPGITLQPLDPSIWDALAPDLAAWWNDAATATFLTAGRWPATTAAARHVLAGWDEAGDLVMLVRAEQVAGIVGLHNCDWHSRKAELRVLLGRGRGRGIGLAATRAMLAIGFDQLNLHRIWVGVPADHVAAIRCCERAGFVREGVLYDDLWLGGRWHDTLRMGILEDRYRQRAADAAP
jgi:RimJ/RimL family protein N-acetyltransferase